MGDMENTAKNLSLQDRKDGEGFADAGVRGDAPLKENRRDGLPPAERAAVDALVEVDCGDSKILGRTAEMTTSGVVGTDVRTTRSVRRRREAFK